VITRVKSADLEGENKNEIPLTLLASQSVYYPSADW